MFEKLTLEDLHNLTSVHESNCVSIYLPSLSSKSIDIEFEAQVRRAAHLLSFDSRVELRDQLLKTIESFHPRDYLTAEDKGISLFVNKHMQKYFITNYELPSKTVVADSFHLKPLIDELQLKRNYHILVITMEEAVFLQSESGKPNILHNFLFQFGTNKMSIHWKHFDESETAQIPHPQSRLRGRGISDDNYKRKSIKLFLKWIEARINKESHYKNSPLYVFATDHLFQAYNSITSHPHPTSVRMGKVEMPRIEHLIHEANLRVQEQLTAQKFAALEAAKSLLQDHKILEDLSKISKAALGGRIKTLFINENVDIWGQLHRGSGQIVIREKQMTSKDDDLLDDIACEVIRHGGEVVVLGSKEMPTAAPASAILNA